MRQQTFFSHGPIVVIVFLGLACPVFGNDQGDVDQEILKQMQTDYTQGWQESPPRQVAWDRTDQSNKLVRELVQFKAADLLENDPEFLKRSSENNNLSRFLDLFRSVEKEQNTTNGMKSKSLDSAVLEMKKIATEMPDNEFQFIGKIRNQAYVRNGPRLPQEAMIKDLLQSLDTPEMKLEALHDASQTVELEINYFLHVQDQLNPGVDAIWNRDHCPEIQAVRKSLQKEFSFLTKYKNKNRNDFDFKKTLSMTESFHLQGFDLNMRIIADLLKKNCP